MRSHTVANLRLDVLRNSRVSGENFPVPDPGAIAESFVMDVFSDTGVPIDLYPNHVPHPHPEAPNRLTIRWVGRETVPVYAPFVGGNPVPPELIRETTGIVWQQVGAKRGADFRSRFWPAVLRRVGKAQLAARGTGRIGDITEAQIATAPRAIKNRLLFENIVPPVGVRTRAIDDAVEDLSGDRPTVGAELPSGTVTNIDATFDSESDGTTEFETNTLLAIGFGDVSGQFRFALSAISAGSTINDSDIQFLVASHYANGDALVTAYGTNGADDPDADTAANKDSKAKTGTLLLTIGSLTTSGSKTGDLGATADGYIAGNISSPATFALGLHNGATAWDVDVEAIENAGSDPATLTVDHTAPTATNPGWYGRRAWF